MKMNKQIIDTFFKNYKMFSITEHSSTIYLNNKNVIND